MRISSLSITSLAVNGTIGLLNAYANPTRWIAAFAVGLLVGAFRGKKSYEAAIAHTTTRTSKFGDSSLSKRDGLKTLTSSMPGLITTIFNVFALQMRRLSPGSSVQRYSGDIAAAALGLAAGQLLFLNKLQSSKDPQIVKALKKETI